MSGMVTLAKQFLRRVIEILVLPYALFKIKNLSRDCGLDKLVDFAFRGCYGIIKPAQVESEILELLNISSEAKPKFTLEIGTAGGGTLFLFSRAASEDATIISIDLPGWPFRGYPQWRIPLYKSFALANQQIHLIRANSHNTGTLEQAKAILKGEQVDFVFIDGDHTYQGVKSKTFNCTAPWSRGAV
jgi:cephalosporin hydroxylase